MMCLDNVYKGKEKKEALEKLPKSGYYWKTVHQRKYGKCYPICFDLPNGEPFKIGWNTTKATYIGRGYDVAFHLHRTKEAAQHWAGTTVRCIVKKKDIVAIGTEYLGCGGYYLTIVTKRFWIPKPRKKS